MQYLIILLLYILYVWSPLLYKTWTVFELDMVFVPFYWFSWIREQSWYWFFHEFMGMVLWHMIWSKVFFLLVIASAIYLIVLRVIKLQKVFKWKTDIVYFLILLWGLLVLFSPFFYERVITQVNIFLSIVMIGYGLFYFFIEDQKHNHSFISKDLLSAYCFFWLSCMITPHAIVMIIVILCVYFLVAPKNIKILPVWLLVILCMNVNWLVGTVFLWENNTLEKTLTINSENIEAFATTNLDWLGVELTTLLQYGFRWERHYRVLVPWEISEWWYIFGSIVLILSMAWLLFLILDKQTRRWWVFFLSLFIISWILWTGVSSSIRWGFIWRMYENIPLYTWMRDAQKWIWIMMLVQWVTWLVALWVALSWIRERIKLKMMFNITLYWILFVWLLILYFYTPHAPKIFTNHILITDRPDEYIALRGYFQDTATSWDTLVLPWHKYMSCERTNGKYILNSFGRLMWTNSMIIADNIEIDDVYSNSNNPRSMDIEGFLKDHDISILISHNVRHIILLSDCEDAEKYNFLGSIDELDVVYHWEQLIMYRINH